MARAANASAAFFNMPASVERCRRAQREKPGREFVDFGEHRRRGRGDRSLLLLSAADKVSFLQ